MMNKNLLALELQLFADDEEDTGAEVTDTADQSEETTEGESEETGEEEEGDAEPAEQTAEENARYAAIRRRAEEDSRRRYEAQMSQYDQQIAALCEGVVHPVTGQPITTMSDYVDALANQQRMAREEALRERGIDPAIIDQAVAQNPIVMQAQQVIEQNKMAYAENVLQNDIAEICSLDPNIKGVNDLAAMPYFPELLDRVQRGERLVDAYKIVNYGRQTDAARQQAINQMRGKDHLASQPNGVATENDDTEVPAEIMKNWKAEGKTEKQIRELYSKVAKQLGLN